MEALYYNVNYFSEIIILASLQNLLCLMKVSLFELYEKKITKAKNS